MIGAFYEVDRSFGCWYENKNTIFVFNWQISDRVIAWNNANPGNMITIDNAKRRTSLHELGHAFGLDHARSGIMLTTDEKLGTTPVFGDRFLSTNLEFTLDNLKDIQSQTKPK
jgi:hypothetical protein